MMTGKKRWMIGEAEVTPEAAFLSRRAVLGGLGGLGALGLGIARPSFARAETLPGLLPAKASERFRTLEALTPEADVTSYNNFYEFGFSKNIVRAASRLKTSPWRIVVEGACDNRLEFELDDLLKKVTLEERIYRHRCVEAWSLVVPWTGFPLADLVKMAAPKSEAKFLRMETFMDPKVATMQSAPQYPWPYVEGLTLAEATNELAFLAVGAYGKPMLPQNGAPLRLVVPWKYGFKSAKSLVRFTFTARRPTTFWEELGPGEYGFWANVNPAVAHPRWSQADERRIGGDPRLPTRLYNGYEAEVAGLYKGMEKEKIFF